MTKNPCTITNCGKPGIPGLLKGAGKCQYHYNVGQFGKDWADEVEARLQSQLKRYALMGRSFAVLATFPDTDEGTDQANAYMAQHPGAAVLAVAGDRVILADKKDRGVPVPASHL